jgi:hypothetical protein
MRNRTGAWFARHRIHQPDLMKMRPDGDHTEDTALKSDWYDAMLEEDKDRLMFVFEDRTRVVNMWRSKGVPCFQVAPGDF